jgi:hypothetical protein
MRYKKKADTKTKLGSEIRRRLFSGAILWLIAI